LIISVLFCVVTADWFSTQLQTVYGLTCSGPRIRRSYSALTYAERETYIKTVFQMKLQMDAWKKGDTRTNSSLYNTFVQMHNNGGPGYNGVWHYTSIFPFAHKMFLWYYESALLYTGVQWGFITSDIACSWGIPYWPWETSFYDKTNPNVIPYLTSSAFSDSDLNGDGTPDTTTGYVDSGYFSRTEWALAYPTPLLVNGKSSTTKDYRLKRLMNDPTKFNLDPSQLLQDLTSKCKFSDFLIYVHGVAHGNMHGFLASSMASQASPDEPMFFMHHGNIDRLWHFWCDCHDYEQIDSFSLTPTQYSSVNPTDATSTNPSTVYSDSTKTTLADTSLDAKVPFYVSGTGNWKWLTTPEFPTVRQLWSMGTSTQSGVNGVYYRYGPDLMASSPMATSLCAPGQSWTWVNYGGPTSPKRYAEYSEEMGTPDEILMYQNLTMRFENFQKEGKTPKEALVALAMESCKANPQQPITEEDLKSLRMMGVDPRTTLRICDSEEGMGIPDQEMDM